MRTTRKHRAKGISSTTTAKNAARGKAACSRSIEALEGRLLYAAHIAGNSTVYSTIQAAVNAAAAGATITVDAGNYAELVTIAKPLTLLGAQAGLDARSNARAVKAETFVTGSTGGSGVSTAFQIIASDVTLDGFTVQGNTSASNLGAGIVIGPNQHGTHILNNIIKNNVTGLYLANNSSTDAAVIQHNVFLNNNNPGNNSDRAIYSDGGVSGGNLTNVLIDGNSIIVNKIASGGSSYEGGIALEGRGLNSQSNVTITNNVLDGTGKLLLYNISNVTIEYNVITHQLDQWSGSLRFEGGVKNALIKFNTVYDNNGPGLSADSKGFSADNSGFTVENNNFYNNNTVYGNKLGVVVTEAAYVGTFDATNNYWGSTSGPGGQGTGTGDTIWGNGQYLQGSGSGWSTVAGDEMSFTPWTTTPNGSLDTPYWGIASTAGAPIQAEDYDHGGNGIGYSTTATSNSGGAYRTGEKVGIEAAGDTGGGYDVRGTNAGQWLNYTTNLSAGGTYNIAFRVANAQTIGGTFHLNVDGQNVTGSMTAPYTGGWQTYQTITASNISLSAGKHVVQLVMDSNGNGGNVANFNWFQFNPVNTTTAPNAPTALTAIANSATSATLTWQESTANIGAFVIQRSSDGINFTPVATLGSATNYVDNGLQGGTTYSYRVYATNAGGNSANSNVAVITTPGIATAPASLKAAAVSSTQINLTWTDTSPLIETGFLIERSTDGINFAQIGTTTTGITTFKDMTVAAGTSYTYRVRATSLGGTSGYSNNVLATTPAAGAITTYLSDMNWLSATSGWNSVQKNLTVAGNPLTLHGATYAKGLGTHAVSQITYNLAGGYTSFISDMGVDDEVNAKGIGSVDFQVIGDGKVLFDSGVLTNNAQAVSLNVDVTGVKTLTLSATNGVANTIDYDHADWASARLIAATAQVPAAPSGLTAVSTSATQIHLAWVNNAPNATGFVIGRSTDGINFTQVATTLAGITNFNDATLTAGTSYTYRIQATNAAGSSLSSNTATAATLASNAVVTYASDLAWVSATAGWATVQKDASNAGNTLTLGGVTYAKGLGTHASSQIVYNLAGGYGNFISDIGIDDEELSKGAGAVDFQVIGDGKVLFDSGVLTGGSPAVSVNVNVTGVQQLTLSATNGIANTIDYDHADWAGTKLISTPAAQSAVVTVLSSPMVSAPKPMLAPALPEAWNSASVGSVGLAGSASATAGVFTVAGAGLGIGGKADSLQYAYQSLSGNTTIVARVASLQSASDEVGLMVRESLAANSRQVALVLTNKGASFIRRAKTAGASSTTAKTNVAAPQWLKLSRLGNVFTASCSADGVHWTKLGSANLSMNAKVYVGLAATSCNPASVHTATFSDVTII